MKYNIAPTSIYKRAYKSFIKKHPELKQEINERLKLLQNNLQNPVLKTHHLTGRLKGLLSFSISYDYRIVFKLEDDTIYLLNIGSHDEVY